MEQSASDFNLKEWNLKPRSSCENTKFRRFSSSNFKSFRQDIPSTPTISSTVSSPGYTIREEIDPSTYSFTAAIKALQAKAVCSWEYLPQHRLTLHSKWSDAEKYISNPLSGEVPLECLSAKTLGARSFSTLSNRITVSHLQHFHPIIQHQHKLSITIKDQKDETIKKKCVTRDVGIQSSLSEVISSRSPSPIQTPSIEERSRKKLSVGESGDSSSSLCIDKEKPETEVQVEEREDDDDVQQKEKEGRKTKEGREKKKMKKKMMMMCSKGGGRRGIGCLPLKGLWQREKSKPRKKNNNPKSSPKTFFHINACYDQ